MDKQDIIDGLDVILGRRGEKITQGDILIVEAAIMALATKPRTEAVRTPADDDWGMGPDGHHAVIAYINNTPDLFALFLELHMLGHIENCDPTSEAFETVFTIANHWRERELSIQSPRAT